MMVEKPGWHQIIVSFYLTLASTANIYQLTPTIHERCNETLKPSEIMGTSDLTVRLRTNNTADLTPTRPIYCWTRFEAANNQFIEIAVKELRLGLTRSNCATGFLRISDHHLHLNTTTDWLPPPTILCGSHNNSHSNHRVRRRTRTPFALVEYKYEKNRPEVGFEYDVTFINKEEDTDRLPYGHLDRKEGRLPNTDCDWLIRADECIEYCYVISPGHPGIYPPNTRCRYLFTNSDNQRVELKFGGKHFTGIFDLRMSKNCEEDYVEVYDGRSMAHPLIGRYCGHNGAHLISSGSSILMIFQSGPGHEPPWNYTGFNMQTTERWNYHNDPVEGGSRKPNSSCDLVFHSKYSCSSDLHTPDYFLQSATNCTYEFHGSEKYKERLEITIVTQYLAIRDQVNCTETLVVYDGAMEMKRLCLDRDNGIRSEFVFNISANSAVVRYSLATGQTSNPDPSWIYFRFWKMFRSSSPTITPRSKITAASKDLRMSAADRYGLLSESPSGLRNRVNFVDLHSTIHSANSANNNDIPTRTTPVAFLCIAYSFLLLLLNPSNQLRNGSH